MIEEGRRIVEAADEADLEVQAAFWLLEEEAARWRFVLATPRVDAVGVRETYRNLHDAMSTKGVDLAIWNIDLRSPNDRLVTSLRKALRLGPGISEVRFSQNVIDDTYVHDALIYRLA